MELVEHVFLVAARHKGRPRLVRGANATEHKDLLADGCQHVVRPAIRDAHLDDGILLCLGEHARDRVHLQVIARHLEGDVRLARLYIVDLALVELIHRVEWLGVLALVRAIHRNAVLHPLEPKGRRGTEVSLMEEAQEGVEVRLIQDAGGVAAALTKLGLGLAHDLPHARRPQLLKACHHVILVLRDAPLDRLTRVKVGAEPLDAETGNLACVGTSKHLHHVLLRAGFGVIHVALAPITGLEDACHSLCKSTRRVFRFVRIFLPLCIR